MGQDDLTDQGITTAIWYVRHRGFLRKVVLGVIILLDGVLVIYAVFGFGRDLFGTSELRRQQQDLLRAQLPAGISAKGPLVEDLQLRGVELIRIGEVTDVIARIQNPNADWYARFSYAIGLGETVEQFEDGFILPQQEGIFVQTIRAGKGTVVFNIGAVSWRRINPRDIPDFANWRDERLNFTVKDTEFSQLAEGRGTISRVKFKILNAGAYSFAAPKFLALLYRGSRLVAIQSTVLDRFLSGQEREVTLSWFERIGAVSNIEVVPAIDIMDPEVYIKL